MSFPVPPRLSGTSLSSAMISLAGAALFAALLPAASLAGPEAVLVKDVRFSPPAAVETESPYRVGDKIFFLAADAVHGQELWVTDGGAEGTHMVKDLTVGNDGSWSAVRMLGQVNGLLLFNVVGQGLWRSDGTAEGTFKISGATALRPHMSLGLFWFEAAPDPALGILAGPWRSDGTSEGTHALPEPAEAAAISESLVVIVLPTGPEVPPGDRTTTIGDSVYFRTDDYRILAYNTTTGLTKDFGVHLQSNDFQGDGNWASVLTRSSLSKMEWYAFRGDGNGLTNLAQDQNWSSVRHAGSLGDVHFAVVRALADHRWYLWRSDGTPAGTRMVKHLPDSQNSPVPWGFARAGDKIFFVTDDERSGREPWVTNGTPEGTMMLKDIGKGSSGSWVSGFQVSGDSVYFSGSDGSRYAVWKSNGTAKGTVRFHTIPKGLSPEGMSRFGELPVVLDDAVYFSAWRLRSSFRGPTTLWRSDGTNAGTYPVMGEDEGSSRPSDGDAANGLHAIGDSVVFRAWDGEAGVLWKSDGTEVGTFPLEAAPMKPSGDWGARNLCNLGEQVLFVNMENSRKKRRTLYSSDGTEHSAGLIPGIPAKAYPTGITNMVRSGEWVYMHTERHLWATGGDKESTLKLVDIATLDQKIVAGTMTPFAGDLIFSTGSLWKADAGTNSVEKIIDSSAIGFYPNNLKVAGSSLYFSGWREGNFQLWKSDGTAEGTGMVKALGATGELKNFTAAGGLLWFTFKPVGGPLELWNSDGTAAGTKLVTSVPVEFGMPSEGPGGRLFFRAWELATGNELWSSDGTAAGTGLVKDIHEGGTSSMISGITRVGDHAYFAATHPVHGRELWKTDGTPEGTALAVDLTGDAGSSSPHHLVLAGPKLFFDAATAGAGREVHVLDVSADLAE